MTFIGVFLGSDFLLELFAAVLIVGAFWSRPDLHRRSRIQQVSQPRTHPVKNAFNPHPK